MADYADRARGALTTISNSADALAAIIEALEAAVFNMAEAATSGKAPASADVSVMTTKLGEARSRLASLAQKFDGLEKNLMQMKVDLANFNRLKKSICRSDLDGLEGKDANARLDAVALFKNPLEDRKALVQAVEVQIRPEVIEQLKKEGKNIPAKLKVDDVYDTKEFEGIVCVIPHKGEALVFSLTHLIINDAHPSAEEIKRYQNERILQLQGDY